jgi:hypothetical protein
MIKADFILNEGVFSGFEISGHSGYDDYGKDIVCAAVSSAAYMTANSVTDVLKINADVSAEDGYMKFVLLENDETAEKFIKGLYIHIKNLAEQYPDFITITLTEV